MNQSTDLISPNKRISFILQIFHSIQQNDVFMFVIFLNSMEQVSDEIKPMILVGEEFYLLFGALVDNYSKRITNFRCSIEHHPHRCNVLRSHPSGFFRNNEDYLACATLFEHLRYSSPSGFSIGIIG